MTETEKMDRTEDGLIDVFDIIADVWKRFKEIWWLLLLVLCICAGVGAFREKVNYREQYEASASFIVQAGGGTGSASAYYNKVTMEQLNATFPYILTSGILNDIVAKDLGMKSVPGAISASVLEETNLFQIRVVSSKAQQAYDILQSVIENYPSVAKYVIGDTTFKLIDESGVPGSPMSMPDYRRAAGKGLLAGMILCLLILLVRVLLRRTIKSREDLRKFLNIRYLAGIPKERTKKRSKKIMPRIMLDQSGVSYSFREAFDTLQIRLVRQMKEKKLKTVVVTSTLAGEGKTTITCNLAYAMAKKGYRVLLIDGDFRNPSVASVLNLPSGETGICDVLKGVKESSEIVCQYEELPLYVMPGGRPLDSVSRLYRNGRLAELIEEYREKTDLILIDTPPCGIMNDAALAVENADGALLVIRQDFARRDKILDGVEMMSGGDKPIIGCVINGEETGMGSYGRYGYGRYGYGRYGYNSKYGYGSSEQEVKK